ncbi:putative RNA-directed DNA polymerase from transposon BS [Trichonephila clavipes]|nr:putative RNA-directed DNA polymerase from transposon BS [Trichonephila clavipes]
MDSKLLTSKNNSNQMEKHLFTNRYKQLWCTPRVYLKSFPFYDLYVRYLCQHDSHLLVYADDIFLYNSGANWNKTIGEMQESLNKISVWCKKWKLSTSPEKSSLLNFSRKRSTIPPLLKICDKPIPEVKSLKILGIIFDPNITWKNHINYLRQKGFKYLNAIKALSFPKIGTRSDHLLNIINATIRSIFDYGSPLFSFSSNSNRQKLEPIYNATLRLALGLPRNTPLDLLRAESMNGNINSRHNFLCQKFITKQIALKDWSPNASNYKDTGKIQMFSFPKEDFLRKKWIQAISRKDFAPSKFSKVCELHFSDDAIRRYTEAYNENTGEKTCVPLKRCRLHDFAVPTIFTDFPTYLSNSGNPTRECPEKRLQRLENEHLQRSIQASIISKEEFEKKKSFTSLVHT